LALQLLFYHDLLELNYIHDEQNEKILIVRWADPKKKKIKGLQTITKDRGKSSACKLDYLLDTIQHTISFTRTFNITSWTHVYYIYFDYFSLLDLMKIYWPIDYFICFYLSPCSCMTRMKFSYFFLLILFYIKKLKLFLNSYQKTLVSLIWRGRLCMTWTGNKRDYEREISKTCLFWGWWENICWKKKFLELEASWWVMVFTRLRT